MFLYHSNAVLLERNTYHHLNFIKVRNDSPVHVYNTEKDRGAQQCQIHFKHDVVRHMQRQQNENVSVLMIFETSFQQAFPLH